MRRLRMDRLQKGKLTLVRDGDYYILSEQGLQVASIHSDDIEDVGFLLNRVLQQQGLETKESEEDTETLCLPGGLCLQCSIYRRLRMDRKTEGLLNRLESILGRYNSEHDFLPGGPPVTWVERELIDGMLLLLQQAKALEARLAVLEADRELQAQKKQAAQEMAETFEAEYMRTKHPKALEDAKFWKARADSILITG